jgi:predicted SprT family Zn-dependent metalloprotease
MSNPALFRMSVKEQNVWTKPFDRQCDGCHECTEYKFSHFRQRRGGQFAVYYCGVCGEEYEAPIGSRQ